MRSEMINHLRTLLLNRSFVEVSSFYGEDSVPWYIDPHFNKVVVPAVLDPVYSVISKDDLHDIDDSMRRVDVLMVILSLADMSFATSFFDKRETVDTGIVSGVRDLYRKMDKGVQELESGILSAATISTGLFAPSGDKTVDSLLSKLKTLAESSYESVVRVASIVLAYAVQLELIRRGMTNA